MRSSIFFLLVIFSIHLWHRCITVSMYALFKFLLVTFSIIIINYYLLIMVRFYIILVIIGIMTF